MEPLLALDRWIRYTQSELQSLRADTIQQREDEKFVHRIQQGQLDSIQAQVREISQQCAELLRRLQVFLIMFGKFVVPLTALYMTSISI